MITIDAKDKTLGRVASAAAKALLGKHSATFAKNVVAQDGVTIINASRVRLSGTKHKDKEYVRYSGYPGGQKIETYANIASDHVISEPDMDTLYSIPLDLEREDFGLKLLSEFKLKPNSTASDWWSLAKVFGRIFGS